MGIPGKSCTCIFDMFLEGCDLRFLLLYHLDLPPVPNSTLQILYCTPKFWVLQTVPPPQSSTHALALKQVPLGIKS